MTVRPGDTFLFDPEATNKPHLWIVLAVHWPELDTSEWAIIASITSLAPTARGVDRTCILGPSNADGHPFIQVDSYVFYRKMMNVEVSRLLQDGQARHVPVSERVLRMVFDGALRSPHTRRGLKGILKRLQP